MKVVTITPRGFCPGVVRAIKVVDDVIKDPSYPRPIQVLGMIVHNRKVVQELTEKGVVTVDEPGLSRLELLDKIDSGTVIITAHGADPAVFLKAKEKGLILVDATCQDVYKTHETVKRKLLQGKTVIFIGKDQHPETEAILGLDDRILLVENERDIDTLSPSSESVFVTNQTTLNIRDLESIFAQLRVKYPNIEIEDEICNSTRIRQEAIIAGNNGVDLCYIVGDPRSNNTQSLVKVSTEISKTKTKLIQDVQDIDIADLRDVKIVSVSSGASTPTKTTRDVIEFLEQYKN
ncbi:MAG: 4-hydroxy-3-methylbut-2-enyl diphosphate reductase [Bacilli bacterium]|nr:4-hydroxy-3-methylbut-2-enyl diphosphate reductase [Bacilli bacterium]